MPIHNQHVQPYDFIFDEKRSIILFFTYCLHHACWPKDTAMMIYKYS